MMKRVKTIAFIFSGLLLLPSCRSDGSTEESEEPSSSGEEIVVTRQQFEAGGMSLAKLEKQNVTEWINVNGKVHVSPESHYFVSSFLGGRVSGVKISTGANIGKGEALFSLEGPEIVELQQEYMEVSARYPVAEANFERQKELHEDNISSQKVFQEAQSNYKSLKARMESLKARLLLSDIDPERCAEGNFVSSITIKAPISGNVTMMEVKNGMYIEPQQEVVEIINPADAYLMLDVYAKDISRMDEGMEVEFGKDEGSEVFKAEIDGISQKVRSDSRSISVRAILKEKAPSVLPGMYVDADILTTHDQMYVLPREAVVTSGKTSYVLMKTGESDKAYHFKQIAVKSRELDDDLSAILNYTDFSGDELFLAKGAFGLVQ